MKTKKERLELDTTTLRTIVDDLSAQMQMGAQEKQYNAINGGTDAEPRPLLSRDIDPNQSSPLTSHHFS